MAHGACSIEHRCPMRTSQPHPCLPRIAHPTPPHPHPPPPPQRCHTTEHMCSLPFLTSPTWQRRIAWVHRAMNAVRGGRLGCLAGKTTCAIAVPFLGPLKQKTCGVHRPTATPPATPPPPVQLPLVTPGRLDDCGAAMDCRVFVSFFQLSVGCVLSTLCLEGLHIPMLKRAGAWPESGASSANTDGGESSSSHGGGGSGGGTSDSGRDSARILGWAARATAYLRWLAEEAEARVEELCCMLRGGSGSRLLTAAGWALMLSLLWMLAMLLEGQA